LDVPRLSPENLPNRIQEVLKRPMSGVREARGAAPKTGMKRVIEQRGKERKRERGKEGKRERGYESARRAIPAGLQTSSSAKVAELL